jgi:DNA polymerase-1
MEDLLILIDGNSLMYRAFYALPILSTDDGVYTNAVYGFLSMMLKMIEEENPSHIAVAFDLKEKTFRNDMYEQYKAGRKPMPDELVPQFDTVKKLLEAMDIKTLGLSGYEADDIIGTLSQDASKKGMKTKIVTGDRDVFQLIDDMVEVVLTKRGITEIEHYDAKALYEKYSLTPREMIDLKGLMGDTSDNIPGIPSVGEKTALKLLGKYETMDGVLEHADEIKGKLGEKVRANIDQARLSRDLATINREIPIEYSFDSLKYSNEALKDSLPELKKLRLNTILKKVGQLTGVEKPESLKETEIVKLSDEKLIKGLEEKLSDAEYISIYIGKDVHLSDGESEYIIPVVHNLLDEGLDIYDIIKMLKGVFESSVPKVVYDAKTLMHDIAKQGISLNNLAFDVFIAGLVLGRPARGGFKTLAENSLGHTLGNTPAAVMLRLMGEQKKILDIREQDKVFGDIEMPLIPIIYDLEVTGFKIDREVLSELDAEYSARISELTQKIYDEAGSSFNVNSPKQLGEVLFENLGLPSARKTKTGYSTDIEVLEGLRDKHDIIDPIIEYRTLSKLKSTYIDGITPLITKDGRLHTTINQIGAVTGRFSSTAPNLQNIPIRTSEGVKLRKAFVASDDEHILVDADYSQIELRILAHISGDENMREAFNSGADIHRRTSAQVFGVPEDEVTKQMRSSAKAVNFGIVYGISDYGLSRQLNIPRKQAGEFIDKYFETFPKVKEFMNDSVEFGRENGYVQTLYGRRIYLPQLRSSNYNQRTGAERVAMNAPIQGTAADIMKLAMIAVYTALEKEHLKSKLILQVHDELIIDACKSELDVIKKLVKTQMEGAAKMDVKLTADVDTGASWYEAK